MPVMRDLFEPRHVIKGPEEFGDRPGLTFRNRPVNLIRNLAMMAAAGATWHHQLAVKEGVGCTPKKPLQNFVFARIGGDPQGLARGGRHA